MAMNRVQFQPGLSMVDYPVRFGEARFTRLGSISVAHLCNPRTGRGSIT